MPPRGVKQGSKRARQYKHIEGSERKQGASLKRAEEIAARTGILGLILSMFYLLAWRPRCTGAERVVERPPYDPPANY
ncbi:MAG TPA: hypothetical protein VGG98_02635 [Solirubrobacteraceae bacterium]